MSPPTYLFQLAGLFDFVEEVVVWIKDRDGRYRWVNRAFLINYAVNNRFDPASIELGVVLGKSDYDLSPGYLADQFLHDDEYVLSGKRIVDRIEQVGQPDGSTVWNVTNKIPLLDVDGSVVGTAGMTPEVGSVSAAGHAGSGVRSRAGLHAGPLPHDDQQQAPGPVGPPFRAGLRAEVPRVLPHHAAEVHPKAATADGKPRARVHEPTAGGCRRGVRLLGSEPLHQRVSTVLRANTPRVPGTLRQAGCRRRSCSKSCR
jgi:hypothetical protein